MSDRRFSRSLLRVSMAVTILTVATVGIAWMVTEGHRLSANRRESYDALIEQRSAAVTARVEDMVDLFLADLEAAEVRLRTELTSRALLAQSVAEAVRDTHRDAPREEQRALVIAALRPLATASGSSFTVYTWDGRELLDPMTPSHEGEDRLYLLGGRGTYAVRDAVDLARGGGGFLESTVARADLVGGRWLSDVTLTRVDSIDSLELVIAIGDALSAARRRAASELVAALANISLDDDEYVFGGTYDGVSIIGPRTGDNMWEARDSDGTLVVQELVATAQTGGGFLEYRLPEATGQTPVRKRSFVKGIPELGWYVGIGFNLDEASDIVARRQAEITDFLVQRMATIGLLLAVLLLLTWGVTRVLTRRMALPLGELVAFAANAADSRTLLDVERLRYVEFRELATRLNAMVSELRSSIDEKQLLLREIHHRVKNNLQLVASILHLDGTAKENPAAEDVFAQSQQRIASMALVHEKLYRSDDLAHIDVGEYLDELVRQVMYGIGRATVDWDLVMSVDSIAIPIDQAIPLGLVATELVSNVLKHGRPVDPTVAPMLEVSLRVEGESLAITVRDNGPGIADEVPPKAGAGGIGLVLVDALVRQVKGTLTRVNEGGCRIELAMPLRREASSR